MAENLIAAKVADALLAYLDDAGFIYPIAFPGRTFAPPGDGRWLKADFFPNQPGPDLINFLGPEYHRGLFQVSVYWPQGEGVLAPMRVAGDVIQLFRRGKTIPGTVPVNIYQTPWISAPLENAKSVIVPATIPWTCIAASAA